MFDEVIHVVDFKRYFSNLFLKLVPAIYLDVDSRSQRLGCGHLRWLAHRREVVNPMNDKKLGKKIAEASNDDIVCIPSRMTNEDESEAYSRSLILEQYFSKSLSRGEAQEALGVKKSRFRDLCRIYKSVTSHLGLVKGKRGPKPGSSRTPQEYIPILEAAYKVAYRTKRASVAGVKREADVRAKGKGLLPLTTHQVRTFVLSKTQKDLDKRKLGKDEYKQKHELRVGKRIVTRLNDVWEMDHTQVDILLVDELDRNRIIGRPWVTMIICALTRVIIGFYLTLRNPNFDSVGAALIFAVLDKEKILVKHGKKSGIYPFCGLPKLIYTDNAAEFVSDYLKVRCARYKIKWDHRPIGKKHYGGTIERVIGRFMTSDVHFLPGATGSNVTEREAFESEHNAKFDFAQFGHWFFSRVVAYNGTIHASLHCSPRRAWDRELAKCPDSLRRIVGEENELLFRMTFLPSDTVTHKIGRTGIYFAGRRYMSDELKEYVGLNHDYEIKYDPMGDLSKIWVKFSDDRYVVGYCIHSREGLSDNWEAYTERRDFLRHHPVLPGQTLGSYDWEDVHAFDAHVESRRIESAVEKGHRAFRSGEQSDGIPELHNSDFLPNSKQNSKEAPGSAITDSIPIIRSSEDDV
jgi:putative transposase